MPLPKDPFLYKLIAKAIDSFSDHNNVTGRSHFAPLLGFNGENAHVQLSSHLNYTSYVPTHPKAISIDQLKILLDELGEDRRIILDGLLKEYDLIAVERYIQVLSTENLDKQVDTVNIEGGDVFRESKRALLDGKITREEQQTVLKEIEEEEQELANLKNAFLNVEIEG